MQEKIAVRICRKWADFRRHLLKSIFKLSIERYDALSLGSFMAFSWGLDDVTDYHVIAKMFDEKRLMRAVTSAEKGGIMMMFSGSGVYLVAENWMAQTTMDAVREHYRGLLGHLAEVLEYIPENEAVKILREKRPVRCPVGHERAGRHGHRLFRGPRPGLAAAVYGAALARIAPAGSG